MCMMSGKLENLNAPQIALYWQLSGGTGDVGSCDGDQGAPLILSADDDPRNDMLVGISSFGPPNSCGGGEQGIPDVFADIPALHEFIRAAAGHGQ